MDRLTNPEMVKGKKETEELPDEPLIDNFVSDIDAAKRENVFMDKGLTYLSYREASTWNPVNVKVVVGSHTPYTDLPLMGAKRGGVFGGGIARSSYARTAYVTPWPNLESGPLMDQKMF